MQRGTLADMIKEPLQDLRERTATQRAYVESLLHGLMMLCAPTENRDDLPNAPERVMPADRQNVPTTMAQLRSRLQEYMEAAPSPPRTPAQTMLLGEKDSPASIFLKLSQLHLKWSELELALHRAGTSDEAAGTSETPLTQDDLEVLRDYLSQSDTSTQA